MSLLPRGFQGNINYWRGLAIMHQSYCHIAMLFILYDYSVHGWNWNWNKLGADRQQTTKLEAYETAKSYAHPKKNMNSRRAHWLSANHILQKRLKTARAASKGHGRWGRSSAWGTSQNHPVIRRRKGYPNTTPGSWWTGVAQSPTTKIFAGIDSLLGRNHRGRHNNMVWPLAQVTPVCPLTRLHL